MSFLIPQQDRRLMWKVDLALIPWLCFLYLLSFLDRTNIGNARLSGLEKDLGLVGHDYNNSLTIFFVWRKSPRPFVFLLADIVNLRSATR